jgi:hypothetical protein
MITTINSGTERQILNNIIKNCYIYRFKSDNSPLTCIGPSLEKAILFWGNLIRHHEKKQK